MRIIGIELRAERDNVVDELGLFPAQVELPVGSRGTYLRFNATVHTDRGDFQLQDRVGFHAYPRSIEFVEELPLTTTGKLQRFVLRERTLSSGAEPDTAS